MVEASPHKGETGVCVLSGEVSVTMNMSWVVLYLSKCPIGEILCGKFSGAKNALEHFVGGFLGETTACFYPAM